MREMRDYQENNFEKEFTYLRLGDNAIVVSNDFNRTMNSINKVINGSYSVVFNQSGNNSKKDTIIGYVTSDNVTSEIKVIHIDNYECKKIDVLKYKYIYFDIKLENKYNFAEKSIEKLMQEFININPSDKNTMRRKDILDMIERLYYIEEKYEKQNGELLTITNVIKTSETEANVYFTIGDSKESYMKIVQLDGDFDKNKMLYTVRNLIMQGKAIIYNTYYEMGSTNWYITKIKEYGGICTKISAEKGLILINIECDDIFLNNFEKYIDETKCIGVSYKYNLNCKNKNVDLLDNLMKLKNKNIIKEYKFGKKDNSDITYLEILVQ